MTIQEIDDATNHNATTTALYTADQVRLAIVNELAKQELDYEQSETYLRINTETDPKDAV
jgi:hypothetical protein